MYVFPGRPSVQNLSFVQVSPNPSSLSSQNSCAAHTVHSVADPFDFTV